MSNCNQITANKNATSLMHIKMRCLKNGDNILISFWEIHYFMTII